MKKPLLVGLAVCAALGAMSCPGTRAERDPVSTSIVLSFSEWQPNTGLVYAAWIEDASGDNLQNLYVCDRILDIQYVGGHPVVGGGPELMGTGIPNWLRNRYPRNPDIDGVTGASLQGNVVISRDFTTTERTIRVCLEIDRGDNGNAYFYHDRPAFTYFTDLIDLDVIESPYSLPLRGWMSNENGYGDPDTQYSQQPIRSDKSIPVIPGFEIFRFMTDLSWIAPVDDMITSPGVTVTRK